MCQRQTLVVTESVMHRLKCFTVHFGTDGFGVSRIRSKHIWLKTVFILVRTQNACTLSVKTLFQEKTDNTPTQMLGIKF